MPSETELLLPEESRVLNDAYRTSGLTVADLASATGISVASIRIALSGIRYRSGQPRPTAPPDPTLAKLASVLGVTPQTLRSIGRERAAEMLGEVETTTPAPDLDAKAAIAGREALARQVLSVFSNEELRTELTRREQPE